MKKSIKLKLCDTHYVGEYAFKNYFTNLIREKYENEFSDNPDYVLYSIFGLDHLKYDNAIKIFFTFEDVDPDFNLCDYAIGFGNMQYEDRYIRFPLAVSHSKFNEASIKHLDYESYMQKKDSFCDFVVSNGGANSIRKRVFDALSEYKKVDSGGRYLNNIGYRVEDKFEFQKKHKFSLAFENGSSKGYTTEKIVDAFAARSIPIYWGNPDIAKDFNPKSFINLLDFNSVEDMIEYVKKVDNDDELYRSMLAEPIFEGDEIPYRFRRERLVEFFDNIFEQSIEDARRRCLDSNRKSYIDDMKSIANYRYESSHNLIMRICNKLFVK